MKHPTLLLRLPFSEKDMVYWQYFTKDDNDAALLPKESGVLDSVDELDQLTEMSSSSQVIVLVPGELVTLRELSISGRLSQVMLKSLPFRLEDELAGEIDELHIAVLEHSENKLNVAVVEDRWMSLWQRWLEEAEIECHQWLPDTLAIPYSVGTCCLYKLEDKWLVRHGVWKGAVCDASWLKFYMDSIDKEQQLQIIDYSRLGAEDNPLYTLNLDAITPEVNLLQGRWKNKKKAHSGMLDLWRRSLILSVMVLIVWMVVSVSSAWQLNNRADELQAQSLEAYQQLFPGERVIRLIPQMNRKLRQLEGSVSETEDLLPLLDSLAPAFKQFSEVKPKSISYDYGQQTLRITAEANAMMNFTRLRDELAGQRDIELESLEQNEKVVTGVLIIKGSER